MKGKFIIFFTVASTRPVWIKPGIYATNVKKLLFSTEIFSYKNKLLQWFSYSKEHIRGFECHGTQVILSLIYLGL